MWNCSSATVVNTSSQNGQRWVSIMPTVLPLPGRAERYRVRRDDQEEPIHDWLVPQVPHTASRPSPRAAVGGMGFWQASLVQRRFWSEAMPTGLGLALVAGVRGL